MATQMEVRWRHCFATRWEMINQAVGMATTMAVQTISGPPSTRWTADVEKLAGGNWTELARCDEELWHIPEEDFVRRDVRF